MEEGLGLESQLSSAGVAQQQHVNGLLLVGVQEVVADSSLHGPGTVLQLICTQRKRN